MRIKKININGFGKFEDRLFLLKPGMNVFYGCNEAGKSTLQSFIRGMLYGLKGGKRSKDGALPPLKQYKPWTAKAYGGILEYELDNGKTYTVARNFDRNTVTVYDEYSNNITGSFPAGREEGVKFAEQHLGLPESCFERTVFIGQMQSILNNEGKKVIAERLANIKQTGDEEISFRKAMEALKEAQLFYVGSERTTTRPLNIINSRLQEAIDEEKEYIRQHESCMDMFLELEQLQKRETDLKKEWDELNRLKEKLARKYETEKLEKVYKSLLNCYKQLSDVENDINAEKEALESTLARLKEYEVFKIYSRNDLDEMISDHTYYKLLCNELEGYESENSENEERIMKIQGEIQQYKLFAEEKPERVDEVIHEVLQYNSTEANNDNTEDKAGQRMKKHASLAGFVAGIIVMIISFVLKPYNTAIFAAGLAVSALAGAFFISSVKTGNLKSDERTQKNIQKQKHQENLGLLNSWKRQVNAGSIHDFIRLKSIFQDKIKQLDDLMIKRQKLAESKNKILINIEEYKKRILIRLTSANIVSGSAFEERDVQKWRTGMETFSMLEQTVRDIKNELASLNQKKESLYREASVIAGHDFGSLTALEREIQDRITEIESLKSEFNGAADIFSSLTPEDMDTRIKQIGDELGHVKLRINTLSTRLENTPDGEMIQKAHERVQILTKEKQEKLFLGKAFDIAMEVLAEASVDLQRNYSPYLNEAVGNIMSTITGGKYRDIRTDDSLRLNIQPPDIAERVIPEQLSSGTADQVYFALRLAAVMLMEKDGETMPLFLDDPFVQYDEERTINALSLLKNESEKRQIILFTCKKREVELVRQIFSDKDINVVSL